MSPISQRDPVILVHGLWMTGLEFGVLRQRLQTRHGFDAHVFSYPSMHGQVDEIQGQTFGSLAVFASGEAARLDATVAELRAQDVLVNEVTLEA